MHLQTRIAQEGEALKEFLEQLIKRECLEPSALGITKKVVADGVEGLSIRQRHVFETYVIREFAAEKCERCEGPIPWSEMLDAYDNGGYCNYCWHVSDKLEKE